MRKTRALIAALVALIVTLVTGIVTGAAQEEGSPTPGAPADALRLRATLRVEAMDGRAQDIPEGSRLRVRTETGTCLEVPLPSQVLSAVSGGGEAPLGEITIPSASSKSNCGQVGKPFAIELALPDGSYITLYSSSMWSPGAADVVLTVAPPIPIPAQPTDVTGLPPTGTGHPDGAEGSEGWPVFSSLAAATLASLIVVVAHGKRRASSQDAR